MSCTAVSTPNSDRELVLGRRMPAPREKVFKAWIHPELLKKWFAPLPCTTPVPQLDVRPGSTTLIMRGPDGSEMPPHRDVYLEDLDNGRPVFTDASSKTWEHSERPFTTVILTLEDEDGKTRYTTRVRHWTVAEREAHEKMGFHQDWRQGANQLAALGQIPAQEVRDAEI